MPDLHVLRSTSASVAVLALVGACVATNPAWDPSGETSDSSAHGESGSTHGGGTGSGGNDDGFGEVGESRGDPSDDGDGDGDPDPSGDGDGDPTGDGDGDANDGVCGNAAPSYGPCPPSCDECHDGVCWRFCSDGECQDDFILCPVSWSCRLLCLGKDACKDATLACTGWGTCEVECEGDNACAHADILCAGGPCSVTCGAGHDKPCEQTEVWCGGDETKLHCEEPYDGSGPSLIESGAHECGCTHDCEPD